MQSTIPDLPQHLLAKVNPDQIGAERLIFGKLATTIQGDVVRQLRI